MPKAINICAAEASEIKYLPNNTVLISINEQHEDLYKLQLNRKDSRILTVQFCDITGKIVDERKSLTYTPMGEEIGLKILNFINLNKEKDFIVHCAAGVSRSAAICLYLNTMFGHELKRNFWSTSRPNPFVYGLLLILRKCKILETELIH